MDLLKVRPVIQLPAHCAPASGEVITAYHGRIVHQEEIADSVSSFSPENGVPFAHMGIFFQKQGFQTVMYCDSTWLPRPLRRKNIEDQEILIQYCDMEMSGPQKLRRRKEEFKEYMESGGTMIIKPTPPISPMRQEFAKRMPSLIVIYSSEGAHCLTVIGINENKCFAYDTNTGRTLGFTIAELVRLKVRSIVMCMTIEPKTSH